MDEGAPARARPVPGDAAEDEDAEGAEEDEQEGEDDGRVRVRVASGHRGARVRGRGVQPGREEGTRGMSKTSWEDCMTIGSTSCALAEAEQSRRHGIGKLSLDADRG